MSNVIFDKKNVLVIGGAGFIGSHLCDELIKEANVICLDNFSSGDEKNIDHLLAESNFEFIKHDISEPIDLKSVLGLQKFKIQFQGVQEVYNLACPMSPNHFLENRMKIVLANSYGVYNALNIAKENEAKFMHFSSSVVYGHESKNRLVSEDEIGSVDITSERAAYDEGKRFAETMVLTFAKEFNIDAKIVRVFRTYGPRMPLNDGQMIPDFVDSALDGKDLEIFGDASFTSSFCYVGDCVDAAMKVMDSNMNEPVNIGSDVEINLTDLAKKIINIIGSTSQVVYKEEKIFMKPLCLPNITKIKNEIGWMPIVTIEKGLESTIYELRANKGLMDVNYAINL